MSRLKQYINEGYIFSDKTISFNLQEFESGKSNTLLIIGVSGSGKSMLGKHLSKKYGVSYYATDKFFKPAETDEEFQEMWDNFYNNFPTIIKSGKRKIIEGVSIIGYMFMKEPTSLVKEMWNYPVIILGKSALKGSIDLFISHRKIKFQRMIKNFKTWEGLLKKFKQRRLKNGEAEIYNVPKL